jgi:hypothetical protein
MSNDIAGYVPVFATAFFFYFCSKFMARNFGSLQQLILLFVLEEEETSLEERVSRNRDSTSLSGSRESQVSSCRSASASSLHAYHTSPSPVTFLERTL